MWMPPRNSVVAVTVNPPATGLTSGATAAAMGAGAAPPALAVAPADELGGAAGASGAADEGPAVGAGVASCADQARSSHEAPCLTMASGTLLPSPLIKYVCSASDSGTP